MDATKEAKKLYDMFLKEMPSVDDIGFGQYEISKSCALRCVDVLSKLADSVWEKLDDNHTVEYWLEVKEEINKL